VKQVEQSSTVEDDIIKDHAEVLVDHEAMVDDSLNEDEIQNDLLRDQAEAEEGGTRVARFSNYTINGALPPDLSPGQAAGSQPITATTRFASKVMNANPTERIHDMLERKHASPASKARTTG
jgi:hypothetical protein